MEIRSFTHKGLKELYTDDDPKKLPADEVDKIKKMLAFLQDMASVSELRTIKVWKAHRLKGDDVWALHVTRNWRLTFRVDREANEICDLNLEDYH